jgi:hypothetical protein
MSRADIKPHPLNPRQIDAHARKRLRESLQRDGLVELLTVNKQTGHLISGHQRLALLDDDAGSLDYTLEVAVIDVPPARERELLIRLNSPSLAGIYDFGPLEALLKDDAVPLDLDAVGIDRIELESLFPDADFTGGIFDKAQDAAQPDIDALKSYKREKKKAGKEADSAEYYCVLVGRSARDVDLFLRGLGLDPLERFHDMGKVAARVGIDLDVKEEGDGDDGA